MEQISNIDFSEHKLKITEYPTITIYDFKKPKTVTCGIKFIVGEGVTSVTGDFGNWVFCREFYPTTGDGVSRGYFDEKLEIYSVQKSSKFDSEKTLNRIQEFIDEFVEYYNREPNEEELDWLERLECEVYDEFSYINVAYRETPPSIEYENVPFVESRHPQLNIVYDAFNKICELI